MSAARTEFVDDDFVEPTRARSVSARIHTGEFRVSAFSEDGPSFAAAILSGILVIFEVDVGGLAENFSSESLVVGFGPHANMATFTAFFQQW